MSYVVSSAHPRLVDGKPSKNPRYLQKRPDLENPRETYLAEIAARLEREIPAGQPVHFPVNSVLAGRRNSPPDPEIGLPPLAVYGPIHYQELPELFMEFISSLTGKSPSMTGFGSEGALTKSPFNALWPVVDLNNALLAAILTGYAGFTTSAGYVGPKVRVDHDISMLVPEIWCRMRVHERDPQFMIAEGLLERMEDFAFEGRKVLASRLGYRITSMFVDRFLGRLFETPDVVFSEEMLRPEKQSLETVRRRCGRHRRGAAAGRAELFRGRQRRVGMSSAEGAFVHHGPGRIRRHGSGRPSTSRLFERDVVLESGWYRERLRCKQTRDVALWQRHLAALEQFQSSGITMVPSTVGFDVQDRVRHAHESNSPGSAPPRILAELRGTIGADPFTGQIAH